MATFTRVPPPSAGTTDERTPGKQLPSSPGLQTLHAQLQGSPAVQAQRALAEQLQAAVMPGRQPLPAAAAASQPHPAAVQRVLNAEVKINTFIKDVGSTGDKNVKAALQKVLTAAERTPLAIDYAGLVSEVTPIANSADRLNRYAKRLESNTGKKIDKELSGDKGHMIDRHVLVDREFQEDRLENQGIEKATRLDKSDKKNYERYAVFLKSLEATVPGLLQTHIETVSFNLLLSMQAQGGEFALANTDPARRKALQDELGTMTLNDQHQSYNLTYQWNVAVSGGGNVTLTCTPELTSIDRFKKIVTEISKEEVVESQEYAPLKMYWGSNKFKLATITAATSTDELDTLVSELNYKLGVTMF